MDRDDFKEALLGIMEHKTHWAWPSFTQGFVAKERLHIHLEQEYATYVRDFPILVARAYIACPIAEVRRELIENVYEEETGGIHAGKPHPELFLEYPRGLGMDLSRFGQVTLLPAARAYPDLLDEATLGPGWEGLAARTPPFVEGTAHARAELGRMRPAPPARPPEDHPPARHYGLP